MNSPIRPILVATVCVLLSGGVCAKAPEQAKPVVLKDGELPLPADYKSWPKFLSEVQRPDAKQVREIYVNAAGKTATADKGFPNGTVFVMENYAAQANPDGSLKTDAQGKLQKGDLARVFVMGKEAGWGEDLPAGQRTGNWLFAAYLPDGQKAAADDLGKCRACHVPLASKDFVHRYDEYFKQAK